MLYLRIPLRSMLCISGFVDGVMFVEFARWLHRGGGRSLPSLSASHFTCYVETVHITISIVIYSLTVIETEK